MIRQILILFFIILNYSVFARYYFNTDSVSKTQIEPYTKAINYLHNSMPDLALPIFFKLQKSGCNYLAFRYDININIAEAYRQKREYKKGVDLLYTLLESDNLSETYILYAYNRLAALYNEWGFPLNYIDSVVKYSNYCIKMAQKNEHPELLAASFNELGFINFKKDEYNLALKNYKLSYYLFIYDSLYLKAANVAINMSNIYIKQKENQSSLDILNKALKHINKRKNHNMFMRLYLQKAAAFQYYNKYDSAYFYLSKARSMQKNYFRSRMDNKIFELSAKYDLKQKELKLREKQQKIKNKQQENIYLLIIILGLLIIMSVSFFVYKLKQKYNRQQENIYNIKQEMLETQLTYKNKELSAAIAHSVAYNEVLESVKIALSSKNKTDAIHIINANIDTERNWHNFLLNFNQLYPNFFSELSLKHPNLTESEQKLSALLMMNLKSKEIASVLNIALTSVNKKRQRLRKSLVLEPETNISEYLSNVDSIA